MITGRPLEHAERTFDKCPNCGRHSDTLLTDVRLWECNNKECRVAYFHHE